MSSRARTRKFQAQTEKLLDLMIHSVYSQKDVFLRELISNASDAIDKVRFLALTDKSLAENAQDFRIELIPDAEAGSLTIRDNGIGMSEDEVIANLGTIARSGAEAFREAAAAGEAAAGEAADSVDPQVGDVGDAQEAEAEVLEADEAPDGAAGSKRSGGASVDDGPSASDLIGQFGVGFYSVFMVADKVSVISQRHGEDHSVKWVSTGGESYMIQRLPPRERGTQITLQLKTAVENGEDEDDSMTAGRSAAEAFTDPATLRRIVKQHSDFIAFPILLETAKPGEDGQTQREPVNSMRPLWTRRAKEIEAAEYDEFYRHITRDWNDPFDRIHLHVEGMREYTALVYLPGKAPMDLYSREHRRGLQLYARRVFIMEECRDLMPEYLRFVRGLVDSPDIPLNISREMVQQDRLLASIRARLTRGILGQLRSRMEEDREAYEGWWEVFGPVLKEGFHYEPGQAPRLRELMLYRSTGGQGWQSLAEYLEQMPEGQEAIYYLCGEHLGLLRESPQLEAFRARGISVLLMPDAVDELVVAQLGEFEGKAFKSAAHGDIDLSGIGAEPDAEAEEDGEGSLEGGEEGGSVSASAEALGPMMGRLQQILDEGISAVRPSKRLTDSAACLVAAENAMSPQLEQMMRAMGQEMPAQKRILELNPKHALIQRMYARYSVNPDDPRLREYAEMLVDQALLAEGLPLENPARFARRVAEAMARGMG